MKENVEVVVKVGFDGKEMSIMTTGIKNVSYSTDNHGDIRMCCLSIRNARIRDNKYKEYNTEYGREMYTNRDEDLWVYESPLPIEFYITRTTTFESPEEDDSKYDTLYDSNNQPYMKVKLKEDKQ
jgi:hypothetical protein|nr:MAG TPA: hypothetical protein [Caudoviricetes sp.]